MITQRSIVEGSFVIAIFRPHTCDVATKSSANIQNDIKHH